MAPTGSRRKPSRGNYKKNPNDGKRKVVVSQYISISR